MRSCIFAVLCWSALSCTLASAQDEPPAAARDKSPRRSLQTARRIIFLGDSITWSGQYVADFEAWTMTLPLEPPPLMINVGLPSETVSGLSEEGHAGGKFPRPVLSERLDRVLQITKPDLVIACYGMNCAIYQPLDKERFLRYQQGVQQLRKRVREVGAQLILVTPPFYDDQRAPLAFSYNQVLGQYSQWLAQQKSQGWLVADVHDAMTKAIARRRQTTPDYTVQNDGVHPNDAGHWLIAQQLIGYFGDSAAAQLDSPQGLLAAKKRAPEILPLVQRRSQILRDAYVAAAGHKRPGVPPGLPLDQAEAEAQSITDKIRELMSR